MYSPTFASVLETFDWEVACLVGVAYLTTRFLGIGVKRERQYRNCIAYLGLIIARRCFLPSFCGLFAPESMWATIQRSYEAFAIVHPISSTIIGVCHLATYWFGIAAFRSKNFQEMIFWCFLLEMLTSLVNETAHHLETDSSLRCVRASFIESMQRYPLNDVVRDYLMPPFLVYGYWFPNFIVSHFYSGRFT
jgi:hypothetical protein